MNQMQYKGINMCLSTITYLSSISTFIKGIIMDESFFVISGFIGAIASVVNIVWILETNSCNINKASLEGNPKSI